MIEMGFSENNIAEQKTSPYLQEKRSLSMICNRNGNVFKKEEAYFSGNTKVLCWYLHFRYLKMKKLVMRSVLSDCIQEKH